MNELEKKLAAGLVGLVERADKLFEDFPEPVRKRQLSLVCWGLLDEALSRAGEEFHDMSVDESAVLGRRLEVLLGEKFRECAGFSLVPRDELEPDGPNVEAD